MVLAAPPIRKLHVGGRSRRHARFPLRKHPLSTSLHRGLSPVGYDFALANGDELVSYTVAKPRKSPVRYYAHSNDLYSVAATTNAAGAVVERYSYNAYGMRTVKNSVGATLAKSAVGQDRGFTSYKLDSETGLYFARTRIYAPSFGKFITRVPWYSCDVAPIVGLLPYNIEVVAPEWSEILIQMMQVGNGTYFDGRMSQYDFMHCEPSNKIEPFSRDRNRYGLPDNGGVSGGPTSGGGGVAKGPLDRLVGLIRDLVGAEAKVVKNKKGDLIITGESNGCPIRVRTNTVDSHGAPPHIHIQTPTPGNPGHWSDARGTPHYIMPD